MKRLFLSITKGEELRFLGHLDFLRTMERALIRANIPVAYSEGFNPHMRLAFDAALSVGVAADPLYVDLKLEKDMPEEELETALAKQLPLGIRIHKIVEVPQGMKKITAFFNEDEYAMEGPVDESADAEKAQAGIVRFNGCDSFLYTRVTPKKTRVMDVRPMVLEPMKLDIKEGRAYLSFSLIRSSTGTVQPKDIWKLLHGSFDCPWQEGEFICSRTGAWFNDGNRRYTPAEMIEREKCHE